MINFENPRSRTVYWWQVDQGAIWIFARRLRVITAQCVNFSLGSEVLVVRLGRTLTEEESRSLRPPPAQHTRIRLSHKEADSLYWDTIEELLLALLKWTLEQKLFFSSLRYHVDSFRQARHELMKVTEEVAREGEEQ